MEKELELDIYRGMENHLFEILEYSKMFDTDGRILASIIYVEKAQEDLDHLLMWKRQIKEGIIELARIDCLKNAIINWTKCSLGYTNIKKETAIEAQRYLLGTKYEGLVYDYDLEYFSSNIEISIKIGASIIRAIIQYWNAVDISNRIDIIGTLYNILDFKNRKPIPRINPESGGVILPTIVDGKRIENVCFGDRVKMVTLSQNMNNFINGKII